MSRQYVDIGGETSYSSGSPIFHKEIKCSEIALQSHYLSAFQHLCRMYISFCFLLQNALGVCSVLTDRAIIPPTLEEISSRYYVRQQLGSESRWEFGICTGNSSRNIGDSCVDIMLLLY